MFDFYSATIFLSVFIMIIMDMLVSGNDLMEHDKKQTVYTISVLVIACMVSEWFGVWMDGADPSLRTLHILVKTIELSTAPIITVLCSDLMTPLKHKKLIYSLIGVHAGLEVLSAFFGFIFSVDAQNVYHHETFYWVYVLAYASGVLLFIGQLLSRVRTIMACIERSLSSCRSFSSAGCSSSMVPECASCGRAQRSMF